MSTTSKFTLALATAAAVIVVSYVHVKQRKDLERLHDGVLVDMERQHMRRIKNLQDLQQQIDLTKQLKMEQLNAANADK